MSLKVKMVSCITMFMLALAMLIVGIYAASVQTIRLNGTVNFEITDKSLYVQDVRLQENENTTPQSLKVSGKFMAGYINLTFNMNLGTFTNSYGPFALYFDIINTSDLTYSVKASTTQSGVTVTATVDNGDNRIPAGTATPDQITPETEVSASVKLTVTAPTVNIVDLNKITVTINELLPTTITALSSNSSLGQAQGDSAFVGEEVTLTANFVGNSADADFLGWRANTVDGELVSTLPEYTFTYQEDSPTAYVAVFETPNSGITYTYDSPAVGEASIANKGVSSSALDSYGYVQIPSMIIRTNVEYRVTGISDASSSSNSAFYSVKSKLTGVTLPDTLTSIGDHAFHGCSSLKSITIPSSVTSIGSYAIQSSGLESVTFGDNSQLLSIDDYAFAYCYSLRSITIPSSVTSIGDYTFRYGSSLESVTFGDNSQLESIGDYAFFMCYNLKTIIITSSVVASIGHEAFRECSKLESVTINAVTPPTLGGSTVFGGSKLTSIYVPSASVDAYKSAEGWSQYSDIIKGIEII